MSVPAEDGDGPWVPGFPDELLERWKPATAHNRYRGAHAFFRWLLDEGEIPSERLPRSRHRRVG